MILKQENVDDLFTYFCSNFPNGTGFDAYDALIYDFPKEARGNELKLRAHRPNTVQLFRTSPLTVNNDSDSDGNTTLNIENYKENTYTPISVLTGLKPAP